MADKKPNPAMEFVVAALKRNPKIDYASVRDQAAKKGMTLYPIMYGRAQALLGLVKVSPRGSKKKAAPKAKAAAAARGPRIVRRGPGRPRLSSAGTLDSLETMIGDLKNVARERDRFQRALESIRAVLDEL